MHNSTSTTTSTTVRTLCCGMALAIGTFAGFISLLPSEAAATEFIQRISATSAAGASSMDQLITRGTQSPTVTRVCLINRSNRAKTFAHSVPRINALQAGPFRGKSCANFSSSTRVHFALFDNGQPVTASRNMVMSLSAFAGGRVDFIWR